MIFYLAGKDFKKEVHGATGDDFEHRRYALPPFTTGDARAFSLQPACSARGPSAKFYQKRRQCTHWYFEEKVSRTKIPEKKRAGARERVLRE